MTKSSGMVRTSRRAFIFENQFHYLKNKYLPVLLSLRDGEWAGCGTRAHGGRRSSRGGLGASEPSAPNGDLDNNNKKGYNNYYIIIIVLLHLVLLLVHIN